MKKNRSNQYQHFFKELRATDEWLARFRNEESIGGILARDEEEKELREQLAKEVLSLMPKTLTPKQLQVARLYYIEGMTQTEIATKLGVVQTSIHKMLTGNYDYTRNDDKSKADTPSGVRKAKKYGGIIKKLRRAVDDSPKIQEILAKIADLSA